MWKAEAFAAWALLGSLLLPGAAFRGDAGDSPETSNESKGTARFGFGVPPGIPLDARNCVTISSSEVSQGRAAVDDYLVHRIALGRASREFSPARHVGDDAAPVSGRELSFEELTRMTPRQGAKEAEKRAQQDSITGHAKSREWIGRDPSLWRESPRRIFHRCL